VEVANIGVQNAHAISPVTYRGPIASADVSLTVYSYYISVAAQKRNRANFTDGLAQSC
jgi:hypothetical protein